MRPEPKRPEWIYTLYYRPPYCQRKQCKSCLYCSLARKAFRSEWVKDCRGQDPVYFPKATLCMICAHARKNADGTYNCTSAQVQHTLACGLGKGIYGPSQPACPGFEKTKDIKRYDDWDRAIELAKEANDKYNDFFKEYERDWALWNIERREEEYNKPENVEQRKRVREAKAEWERRKYAPDVLKKQEECYEYWKKHRPTINFSDWVFDLLKKEENIFNRIYYIDLNKRYTYPQEWHYHYDAWKRVQERKKDKRVVRHIIGNTTYYENGDTKEVLKDGTIVNTYADGRVETIPPSK